MNRTTLVLSAIAFLGVFTLTAGAHSAEPTVPGGELLPTWIQQRDDRFAGTIHANTMAGAAADDEKPYGVSFKCPLRAGQPDAQVVVDRSVCPQYVIDLEDLMGNPALAVDPNDPDVMAFHSLHGGRGIHPPLLEVPPPTDRSRYNLLHQPHTTFQTRDMGASWHDNRYYAPDALSGLDRVVYGEDNAITMDSHGNVYLASLYAHRDANEKVYHWAVGVWKAHRANKLVNYYENYAILHDDDPASSLNTIQDLHLTYNPQADRVILLWLERQANGSASLNGKSSWVMAYWTKPGEGAHWERLPMTQQVGPCRAITRPISYKHEVFFGCFPDTGYAYGTSDVSHWQIHALDAQGWTTRYMAATPIGTSHGTLVDFARTGYMLFIGSGVDADGRPQVLVSRGTLGGNWADSQDFGPRLARAATGVRTEDARVTAAAFKKETGYIHLLYQERYASSPDVKRVQNQPLPRMFNKTFAVLHWEGSGIGWAGRFDNLNYGQAVSLGSASAGPQFQGMDDSIFEDLHDDIVAWHDPFHHRDRIFVVFGDYGSIRFAEVLEHDPLPVVFLPPIEAPAIPLAAAETAANTSGAVAGAITGLMLLRLLAARKKARVSAPA